MSQIYDIAVYGASGFTGRIAAKVLAEDPSIKLVLAGRDLSKLQAVAKVCRHVPDVFVADAQDAEKIRQLVDRSKVIINFAGPFSRYAETLVAACAELGRSYCDITGETFFIADMIQRYEAKALASGAVLIPMAGFDSVPADVTSYLAVREARKLNLTFSRMDHYYKVQGGFNGGTIETAMTMGDPATKARIQNENILIPDKAWPKPIPHHEGPRYEPYLKRWTAPFFMQLTNAPVVRRSLFLAKAKDFAETKYGESLVIGPGPLGRAGALAVSRVFGSFMKICDYALGRKLVRTLAPAPGEGPSERSQAEGFYSGTLLARVGEDVKVVVKMKAKGDPSNLFTVLCATEIGKLLLEGDSQSPGFTTATQAFGQRLIDKLIAQGVSIDVATL